MMTNKFAEAFRDTLQKELPEVKSVKVDIVPSSLRTDAVRYQFDLNDRMSINGILPIEPLHSDNPNVAVQMAIELVTHMRDAGLFDYQENLL